MTTFQRLMITKGVIKESQIASLLGETSSEGQTSESGDSQPFSSQELASESPDMIVPSTSPSPSESQESQDKYVCTFTSTFIFRISARITRHVCSLTTS